ncbi:wax ester/triacylglycerol synthase family O-acyltransferase [Nocardia arthritidis]|uniref:wax ester/triacylglycerol synthase family O-acyltransferase n=1 Tax=Nocardia arthritidis TaxID=228602 RepID=UPI001EEB9376
MSAGICAVAIVAGAQPGRAEVIAALRDHLDADARLRQKVRRARWDMAAPEWVDDPNFGLAHHIRWMALPEPGDDAALNELIASVMEERLDRDHPLWQCIVVERLTGGRWALIVKVHHSMVDGISGITLFERLCEGPQGNSVRPAVERTRRDPLGLLAKGLRLPIDAPKAVLGAVPLIMDALAPAPDSSLNGPIGRQRRYAVARTSLSAVREIGVAFGATVNDVALAAVAAAFRAVLLARGEEPTPDKLRILAPVSTRATDAKNVLDNRVSAMLPLLPIELADPVAQLAAVHERMARHKRRGEASAANSILELANWLPFASIAWIVRSVLRYPQHSVAGLATNVPGPRRTLRLLGREVVEILAYAPIAMRLRTGIAILSYRDQLAYGITGDFDSTPDIALIADGIERATAELLARARAVAVPVG